MASKAIRIPAKGGKRQGADDVIAKAGDAAFNEIVDAAIPAHASATAVVHAAGLDALGEKPSVERIEAALRSLRENVNGADPLRRATIRTAAIDALQTAGVRTSTRLVDAALGPGRDKADTDRQGKPIVLSDPEPWPEPVDGADLINDMLDLFRRYLVLPKGGHVAIALWILHTHLFDLFQVSPFLILRSPTKRAGKTRCLTIVNSLVPRPLLASSITPSCIFRSIERFRPTLLVDEFDTHNRSDESLRGVLDSGHAKAGAYVLRSVGDDFEPRLFSTWSPKAIASIGDPHETIADRGITINMRRRAPGEKIERLRIDHLADLEPMRQMGARWARDNADALRRADPEIPAGLSDRAADNWFPLLAIADLCGTYADDARWAAVTLSGEGDEGDSNIRVRLLADVRSIFAERKADAIPSDTLLDALAALDNRPWPEWKKGRPITAVQLGRLLAPFGIFSRQIWTDGQNRKGYTAASFEDAWTRYLADPNRSLAPQDSQKASPEPAPDAESSLLAAQKGGCT